MNPSIDVTVAAIIERAGRFLMVEEHTGDGIVFNQPAGHLEPGESLLDAVVRETLEETGYKFRPQALVGFYRWEHADRGVSFLRLAFAGEASDPNGLVQLDDGIIASHWLSRDQLLAQPGKLRSPMVLRCVDDYLAGQRLALNCLVDLLPGANRQAMP
jgi:8-oxo-dGTP pyrophosphatase MutT (NUDIX family)